MAFVYSKPLMVLGLKAKSKNLVTVDNSVTSSPCSITTSDAVKAVGINHSVPS